MAAANAILCHDGDYLSGSAPTSALASTDQLLQVKQGSSLSLGTNESLGTIERDRHVSRLMVMVDGRALTPVNATDVRTVTVPSDAERLEINGQPGYYGELCGKNTLAWQWKPGLWASIAGFDAQQYPIGRDSALTVANSLVPSTSAILLPFAVNGLPAAGMKVTSVNQSWTGNTAESRAEVALVTPDQKALDVRVQIYPDHGPGSPSDTSLGDSLTVDGHPARQSSTKLEVFLPNHLSVIVGLFDNKNQTEPHVWQGMPKSAWLKQYRQIELAPSMADQSTWFPVTDTPGH